MAGGYVICRMPAPLEATETLLPNVMDMDRSRYLFKTPKESNRQILRPVVCGCLQTKYQLEEKDAR